MQIHDVFSESCDVGNNLSLNRKAIREEVESRVRNITCQWEQDSEYRYGETLVAAGFARNFASSGSAPGNRTATSSATAVAPFLEK